MQHEIAGGGDGVRRMEMSPWYDGRCPCQTKRKAFRVVAQNLDEDDEEYEEHRVHLQCLGERERERGRCIYTNQTDWRCKTTTANRRTKMTRHQQNDQSYNILVEQFCSATNKKKGERWRGRKSMEWNQSMHGDDDHHQWGKCACLGLLPSAGPSGPSLSQSLKAQFDKSNQLRNL